MIDDSYSVNIEDANLSIDIIDTQLSVAIEADLATTLIISNEEDESIYIDMLNDTNIVSLNINEDSTFINIYDEDLTFVEMRGIVIPDGDKGQVTVANSGTSWTINDNVFSSDKLDLLLADYDLARLQFIRRNSANTDFEKYTTQTLDNVITINSLDDFPIPEDWGDGYGVAYHFVGSSRYVIGAPLLIIPYPIVLSANVVAHVSNGDVLVYVGSGAMINIPATSTNAILILENLTLIGTGSSTLFNIENGRQVAFRVVYIEDFFLGTISGVDVLVLERTSFRKIKSGLSIINTLICYFRAVDSQADVPIGDSVIKFYGSVQSIGIVSCQLLPIAGDSAFYFDIGLAGFIDILGTDVITLYGGTAFHSASITQSDIRMLTNSCRGIPDSTVVIDAHSTSTPTITDVPAVRANIILNKTSWQQEEGERLYIDTNGLVTYFGLEDTNRRFTISANIEPTNSSKIIGLGALTLFATDFACTFSNATDVINCSNHGKINGDKICFAKTTGGLPTNLRKDVIYYVVNSATNTFQVSYEPGGSVVTFTTDGVGNNSFRGVSFHGLSSSGDIAANNPFTISSNGIVGLSTNDLIAIYTFNLQDTTDIKCNNAQIILN